MRIQIKTLKSKKYELEVKADETVEEIKDKIQKELKLGEASMMSLIHHGKILKNEQTADNAGFKENDFVVLMVKKKKRKKTKKRETPQTTTTSGASAATEHKSSTATSQAPAASAAPATENSAAAQSNAASGANAFVMGNQLNEAVQNLVSMGFPEADVQRAMRAAFNNPERAAEYLLTGIPQNVGAVAAPAHVAAPPPAAQAAANQRPAAANNPLGAAAAIPQQGAALPQGAIQQMMAQNPESVAAVLQHVMRNRPELFQAIGADGNINQAAIENLLRDPNFMQMMMQSLAGGAPVGARPGLGAQGQGVGAVRPGLGMGRGMMGQVGAQQPPMGNANVIRMTHAEAASVDRLKNIGFSQQQALEAFLVCNKNEQMAANYLFENANDFAGPAVAAPAAAQPVAAQQPVNPAPPVQPVAAEVQAAAVQANDAQAEVPQADEVMANDGPVNQFEAIAQARRAASEEAKNNNNADGADEAMANDGPVNQFEAIARAQRAAREEAKSNDNADGAAADAKDQEMEDPNK